MRFREIAARSGGFACGYKVKDLMVLPESFTEGARVMAAFGNKANEYASVRFTGSPGQVDRKRCRTTKNAHCRQANKGDCQREHLDRGHEEHPHHARDGHRRYLS